MPAAITARPLHRLHGPLVGAVLLVAAVPGCASGPQPVGAGQGTTAPRPATSAAAAPAPTAPAGAPAGAPAAGVRAFRSPSGNISCEFDQASTALGQVYCQTGEPQQSVRLGTSGTWSDCHGPTCVGDPGEGVVALPYGSAVSAGPFTCASAVDCVTCTTGGVGFRIASQGIVAVPQAGA